MNFYEKLDKIMRQDLGNRGLLPALPANPIKEVSETLKHADRVLLLTGFPVRIDNKTYIGETDGPSGTANLAAALTESGAEVLVLTDRTSYDLLETALNFRAPKAKLSMIPEENTEAFEINCIKTFQPTHFISLERPGKARDGHFHNMRGEIIDDMITDSSLLLHEAKKTGAVTISIGDGGNEMGMGTYRKEILEHVPCGEQICTADSADLTLTSGVSNWWGWGIAALLSLQNKKNLLPSAVEETELLRRVVLAGGVDGCTKKQAETVDNLSLETHLSILRSVKELISI